MRDERGLTLVEVTIAVVLASLIMVGLVGFYVSSQMTWVDSSTKVIAQRDATFALEEITRKVRESAQATQVASPNGSHMQLFLYDTGGNPSWHFWWEPSDSLIHHGPGATANDGPLMTTTVTRFQVSVSGASLVKIDLDLLTPNGEAVALSTAAALYNRP